MIRYRLAPDTYLLTDDAGSGHAVLKAAADASLAELLDIPGRHLAVSRTPRGRPVLDTPASGWLSRAHRHGLTLIAASRAVPIGADLEIVDDGVPHLDIAHAFFDPAEAAWLETRPLAAQPISFCALWTIKEAVLKATGEGIANGLAYPCLESDGRAVVAAMGANGSVRAGGHTVRLFARQLGNRSVVAAVATPLPGVLIPGDRGNAGSGLVLC